MNINDIQIDEKTDFNCPREPLSPRKIASTNIADENLPSVKGDTTAPETAKGDATAPETTRTVKIQWDRNSFEIPVPTECCTLDECMVNFYAKSKIDAIIARAKEPWKSKLIRLKNLLLDFFRAQYDNKNLHAWDLNFRNLVGTTACVYWALFHDGSDKDGMTFRGRDRVLEQKDVQVAALLMTLDEARARVPEAIIDAIVALLLPGLQFHADKKQYLKDLILMQICEGFLACCWGIGSGIILERLLQVPSAKVEATITPIAVFGQDALDWMKNIPNSSVSALLTWPTLPSTMREMAKSSEFLQAHVHEEPPQGGFVTLNRLVNLFGEKLGSWQDAVEVCPRLVQLDQIVANLSQLLRGDIEDLATVNAIQSALVNIQGKNYSHYVRPSEQDLAEGAHPKLEAHLSLPPYNKTYYMERTNYHALEEEHPDWLAANIDTSSEIRLLPNRALSLLQSKSGHRIEVTASYFVPFAPYSMKDQRFEGIKAYAAKLDLMHASGHITTQKLSEEKGILRSFLMALEFGSDDYEMGHRMACNLVFPDGYFRGPKRDTKVVSKHLNIGSYEALYIRHKIGQELFNKLLTVHGLQLSGPGSPFELEWKCQGRPAIPALGIDAVPCTAKPDDEGQLPYNCTVGGIQRDNPLFGHQCCQPCHRGFVQLEYAILQNADSLGTLTEAQSERFKVINQQREDHRQRHHRATAITVAEKGKEYVQAVNRGKNRRFQNRLNDKLDKDPEALKAYNKKKASQSKSSKPKPSGILRRSKTNAVYPPKVMANLTEAMRRFVRKYGKNQVSTTQFNALFDLVLIKENELDPTLKITFLNEDDPNKPTMVRSFYGKAYDQAVEGILVKKEGRKKSWAVVGYDTMVFEEPNSKTAKTAEVLMQEVIDSMYDGVSE